MTTLDQNKLKIFISYSRKDCAAFAEDLVAGLELLGFDPFLDLHDIAAGEDWEDRLAGLIQASDTVVYLISPASMKSEMCSWEVAKTVQMGKRLIPLVVIPVDETDVPRTLKKRNYIFFDKPHTFARALGELSHALKTDYDWIREHTRLSELANRWIQREKIDAQLLRGAALEEANNWMGDWMTGAPDIPDSVRKFIQSSGEAQTNRANKQRQQLEEMAQAQAAKAQALAEQEVTVKQLSRRTTMGLFGAGGLTVLSSGLAYWGNDAERRYRNANEEAEEAKKRSVEAIIRKEAMRTDIFGQLNAFAASPGQFALDGYSADSKNSPYTLQLIKELSNRNTSLLTGCVQASQKVRLRAMRVAHSQTPYLATDMNGDIYLQRQPDNRRRIAIIVSQDKIRMAGELKNVERDALAWQKFLETKCGFKVRHLKNPDQTSFEEAIHEATFPRTEKHGNLAHPLLQKTSFAPLSGTKEPANLTEFPNTLLMFIFSGYGVQVKGINYLMASDTPTQRGDLAHLIRNLPRYMIPLAEVQTIMRKNSAASIFILDTNFDIIDKPNTR